NPKIEIRSPTWLASDSRISNFGFRFSDFGFPQRLRMYLLDRLLIRSFFKSYAICLISLLTLYVVVDLFTNLDDYTDNKNGLREVIEHIGAYYGPHITKIFNSLSEVIVLLAATFTVALI